MRQVGKWHKLEDGGKAARWLGEDDVRGFRPVPEGFKAEAALVDTHPATGKQLKQSEWWIILTPERR